MLFLCTYIREARVICYVSCPVSLGAMLQICYPCCKALCGFIPTKMERGMKAVNTSGQLQSYASPRTAPTSISAAHCYSFLIRQVASEPHLQAKFSPQKNCLILNAVQCQDAAM